MADTTTRVRPFAPADYDAFVGGSNRCYPDYATSVEEVRHRDAAFDDARFFRVRLVAEEEGRLVGGLDAAHRPGRFHPDRYWMDLWVVPESRRRGHGSALYDEMLRTLRARNALAVTAGAKESMAEGVEFLRRRGWVERKRDWESRLRVAGFDHARFADVDDRVAREGIRLTTYAEEARRDGDAERNAFELTDALRADVPAVEPPTPVTFEEWRQHWTASPTFLPDAFFVAIDRAGRWLGMSNLEKQIEDPTFVWQGLTGVRREARGRGIAMALKLRTVEYARRMGVDHIKTWNDQRNLPMLRINEAMGFEKQPAWIAFELRLRD